MKKVIAILLILCMLLPLLFGCGENKAKYNIGICQLVTHPALDDATQGFMDALIQELGKENLYFDVQNAANDSANCALIANSFVSKGYDLILANATAALQAAANATEDIPVLGTSITEYGVALELDNFNGLVGTNVSGTSDLAPLDLQAQMILDWYPEAKKIGLLYCASEPNSLYQVTEVKKYLENKNLTVNMFPFADSNDLPSITQNAASWSDVIYVPTDNTVASSTGIIDGICRPAKVPVIAGEENTCKGCGVATLSISYYDLGVTTGKMAAKILKGEADISEMKIEYTTATPKYNAEICQALGKEPVEGYEAMD